MSENENYLDQEQARTLAGVGLETILRYRDLGLLRVYTVQGEEKFSEEDVRLLFNSKIAAVSQPVIPAAGIKLSGPTSAVNKPTGDQAVETRNSSKSEKPSEPDLPRLRDIVREEEAKKPVDGSSYAFGRPGPIMSSLKQPLSDNSSQVNVSYHQDDISGRRAISSPPFHGQHNSVLDISSIELLELTRSLKDQLEIVKDERNWLRRRVEKLESQAEREQMIVMSETETIRSLVMQKESAEKRKSPWAFLLSWTRPVEQKALEQSNNIKPQDKSQA